MLLSNLQISDLQRSFDVVNASVSQIAGNETAEIFSEIFGDFVTRLISEATASQSTSTTDSEGPNGSALNVDTISAGEPNGEGEELANSPNAAMLQGHAPLAPNIGMSLRRAIHTPGHQWYQANVISVYDNKPGYLEVFGSHKVDGVEIIPGAENYDKEQAATYLDQARQHMAQYWNRS